MTKTFSQFGIVFVKIKRDSRGMPFAFCQYTVSQTPVSRESLPNAADTCQNDQDAQSAMKQGKGVMILERPCRTEMARAHCELDAVVLEREVFADFLVQLPSLCISFRDSGFAFTRPEIFSAASVRFPRPSTSTRVFEQLHVFRRPSS